MKTPKILMPGLLSVLIIGLAACGPATPDHSEGDGHGHGEDAPGSGEESRTSFSEGKGISLPDETKTAIGLRLSEVEERALAPIIPVETQIYRASAEASRPEGERTGNAYASALLPPDHASSVKPGDPATLGSGGPRFAGKVWKVDPSSRHAVNSEEVIVEIPDAEGILRVGAFLSGTISVGAKGDAVISIPRSAVLETATGKFAYVQNGEFLLRTPISTGAESADFAEITDGIYAGDTVVSEAVETLYLIELRATKGGGHSH